MKTISKLKIEYGKQFLDANGFQWHIYLCEGHSDFQIKTSSTPLFGRIYADKYKIQALLEAFELEDFMYSLGYLAIQMGPSLYREHPSYKLGVEDRDADVTLYLEMADKL